MPGTRPPAARAARTQVGSPGRGPADRDKQADSILEKTQRGRRRSSQQPRRRVTCLAPPNLSPRRRRRQSWATFSGHENRQATGCQWSHISRLYLHTFSHPLSNPSAFQTPPYFSERTQKLLRIRQVMFKGFFLVCLFAFALREHQVWTEWMTLKHTLRCTHPWLRIW